METGRFILLLRLYYLGMGGVRLENVVLVTKTGNRNLTKYPKFLEV